MEQADMEQRQAEAGSWIHADSPPQRQQLENSFDPATFVNVGTYLSSQQMQLTANSSSQTPATATDTQADATPSAPPVPPPAGGSSRGRRIFLGMAAVVVVLLGTSVHFHSQNRALEAENFTLRARVTQLENASTKDTGSSQIPATSCGGNQLIDTCWLKMGWGDCTENVMEDYSMKPFEDAFRVAWDSTAEVVGIVSDTVKSDLRQVCDAIHSLGRFIFEL